MFDLVGLKADVLLLNDSGEDEVLNYFESEFKSI